MRCSDVFRSPTLTTIVRHLHHTLLNRAVIAFILGVGERQTDHSNDRYQNQPNAKEGPEKTPFREVSLK